MRSSAEELAEPFRGDTARNRFVTNVASNVGYLILNTAVMLWYVPFLVRSLGVAAYGMISLANSLVAYSVIVSASVDSSINRFLAIDLNQGAHSHANRTFNTALALSLVACGALLGPLAVLSYFFPVLFNVPPGLGLATQFLFAAVGITTLTGILSGNFAVVSVIMHRFDLRNLVRSFTAISRVGVVALSFQFWPPSLWPVAAGFILSACIGLIGDVLVWRKLAPQLYLDLGDVDRHRFRALFGLSSWATIDQLGFLLLTQVNLVIVNAMFGAATTGRYGALVLLSGLIVMMTWSVSEVVRPAIMGRYAAGDVNGVTNLAGRSVKILASGLALPIGLLCGFGRPLLTLWLGPEFADQEVLLILIVSHLTLNLSVTPLVHVITAYSKVRLEGLLTLTLGVLNIPLAIVFARLSGWGVAGVAAATACIWTVRNFAFLPSYSAKIMGLPWWTFYGPLIRGALATVIIALVSLAARQIWSPATWLSLGATATVIGALYCFAAYFINLNRSDRELLRDLVGRKANGIAIP